MANNTFNFLEVKFKELTDNVNTFIQDLYNKSDINLSPASPYGQILQVITKIYESSNLYMKNVLSRFDLNNRTNNDVKMVNLWARVAGYSPSRAISATGTISLQLRPSTDPATIGNNQLIILNNTKINNKSNNLDYFIDLGGQDQATFTIDKNKKIFLPIVQGKKETRTETGNNTQNFSITVVLPNNQSIENYRTVVKVNGVVWNNRSHLRDMLPDENAWYGRTGIEGGLDVYFGTGNFGKIPPLGSKIEITYVISNGSLGNIPTHQIDDFTFIDDIFDGFGDTVDVSQNFITYIENEVSLGSDAESVQFTKSLLPYASRNFVLARPEQFIFMLKRLNFFSQIDAFTTETNSEINNGINDDSVIYLFLIPNTELYLTGGNSYFTLDLNAFTLDDSEKLKIETYLRAQGIISVGVSMLILDPIINQYLVNIYLRVFEDANEENIRTQILIELSNYFGNQERRGRIDKSAIIAIIEAIDGVDSIMLDFVCKANEDYHGEFITYKENVMKNNPNQDPTKIVLSGYQPNKVIGLDPQLGDIVYTKNELPIIRGGWKDRYGVYYQETPQINGLSSVNIAIVGISKRTIF